jgi:hypothetical protein
MLHGKHYNIKLLIINNKQDMGVRQWRKKGEDGRKWARIVREAKVKLKRII